MNINKVIKKATALNLEIRGSIGTFQVGQPGAEKSIEVRYLTSHVGFDATGDSNNLLSHIAPVREIFDFNDLDFSEIMQRDIDDARVTKDMIPYLLDPKNRGLVKFFPPIVIAIAAVDKNESKPSKFYPPVTKTQEQHLDGYPQDVVQSGELGSEVFRFECPLLDGELCLHDGARLKLNTSKSRLIILDGQHRAMALLALHRNLKNQWSDAKRAPYANYYAQWTREAIEGFDLSALRLPVIICAFPDVDSAYTGELDITRAIRAMFLTLNKTARKVTNSRNVMLDDSDLIAHFTRVLLSDVKQVDADASHSLRIWNVELDQVEDRTQITSPAAITGVSHAYYAVEHLLLNDGKVKDIAPRAGKFKSIKAIDATLLDRLAAVDVIGNAETNKMRRDNYRESSAVLLEKAFRERYGNDILRIWRDFAPFSSHCRAAYNTHSALSGNVNAQVRPILFDGQSTGRNFEEYLAFFKDRAAEAKKAKSLSPFQEQHLASLNGTKAAVEDQVKSMYKTRADLFIDNIAQKADLRTEGVLDPKVVKIVNGLYQNVFTTVAFQAAVVCGFFHVMERVQSRLNELDSDEPSTRISALQEYIDCLNKYFRPGTVPQLRNLLKVFSGNPGAGAAATWKEESVPLFRTVVYGGEMKPDEWPKYRYIGLELWEPSEEAVKVEVERERATCRVAVFRALHTRRQNEFIQAKYNTKQEPNEDEKKEILAKALELHNELIDALGKGKSKIELKQARAWIQTPADVDSEQEDEADID